MQVIAFDIGGTHLRAGLVNQRGPIKYRCKKIVGSQKSPKAIVDLVVQLVDEIKLKSSQKKISISLGIPGIVNSTQGIVYASPHYPQWKNVPFKKLIQNKIKLPVFIDNDAHMIARGEAFKGTGKGLKSFLMVTLGTGIGGALVSEGQVLTGDRGFAGEFGHVVIDPQGPACGCGGRGCLETFASASALNRLIQSLVKQKKLPQHFLKQDPSLWVEQLATMAKNNHKRARQIFADFGRHLAIGLASIVSVTGIQTIILGGSIAKAYALFIPTLKQELPRRIYPHTAKDIKIRRAQLSDDAGLWGGVYSTNR